MAQTVKSGGTRLARIYAEALMANAQKTNQVDAIGAELEEIVNAVFSNASVANYITTPVVSWRTREPRLQMALGNQTSSLMGNFIGVLNRNGRLGMIRQIREEYQSLQDAAAGRVRVTVKSAVPFGGEQQNALASTLAAALKKQPVLNLQIDPDLLGGIVVQIGDKVIDTSVRTRIQTLRAQLMERGTSYVLQN